VNTLVMFEIFYLFNSRYLYHSVINLHGLFGNRLVWLAIILLTGFQMAFTYWQPMQVLFGTVDIDAHTWQMIVAVASSVFILTGVRSYMSQTCCLESHVQSFRSCSGPLPTGM